MLGHTIETLNDMLANVDDDTLAEFGAVLQQELDFKKSPTIYKLELFLTHRCNLRCDYCFLNGSGREGDMPIEIADKALEFLMKQSKSTKDLKLVLFGGEPLLCIDLMELILEQATHIAEVNDKVFGFSCTTNGLLIDERAVELAQRYNFNYLISIDGTKDSQDSHRKTVNGEGTYDKLIDRIIFLKPRQGWMGVRMTITPETISSFARSIEELVSLGINQFLIDFLADNSWRKQELAQIKEQYHSVLNLWLQALRKGHHMILGNEESRVLRGKKAGIWGCGAGSNTISVAANGDVYPCSRMLRQDGVRMGNITDGKIAWNIGERFHDMRTDIRWKCLRCEYSDYCAGGCPGANVESNGTPYYPTKVVCAVAQALAELESEYPEFAPLLSGDGFVNTIDLTQQPQHIEA